MAGCAIEVRLLRAAVLRLQGQTPQAMMTLSRALSLAEPEGYLRVFLDEGPRAVALLREARSRGVTPTYLDALLVASGSGSGPEEQRLVEPLSPRELELLRLLAAGLTTAEVAGQLYITTGTARNHLKSIYGKLDVHGRVQAIARARALNLL
jgi:LuxR family maltose regulon positive regulatory protein